MYADSHSGGPTQESAAFAYLKAYFVKRFKKTYASSMTRQHLLRLLYRIFKQTPLDVSAIEREGLLAIKIGQTFALRLDFLDAERCNALSRLYTATTAIPAEQSEQLLKQAVAPDWFKRIATIDYTPLASASIGQVITGQLTSGEPVVIKLVKGEFKQQFQRDMRHAKQLMRWAIRCYPKLEKVADPIGILQHIQDYTLNELELRHEVAGHQRLYNIYEQYKNQFDLSKLKFAKLHPELSNDRVLVSERLTGQTLDKLLQTEQLPYRALLELFHIHGFYLFGMGTFHGDIHPGNIILQDGNYYFIDTAAISRVGDRIRVGLFYFFEKLSSYDYEGCAYYLNQMAEHRIEGNVYEQFKQAFLELYAPFTNSTVSQISLTRQMMHTIKLGVNHGMVFEHGMYGIIKSLMYLDGMVLRCNPDAVLLKDMRPFIDEFKPFVGKPLT